MQTLPYLPVLFGNMLLYLAGGYHSGDSYCDTFGTAQEERGGAGGTQIRFKKWGCRDIPITPDGNLLRNNK